ncbi:hypothetical protein E3226_005510 [Legionella geestiana]|uniref:hypothetical protein n=1 Tax=Legionella geestiana TaxID=45065 RepID=UPI001091A09C|nr:hypothetical protein [Legionella geestiana]QDQ39890.1 hypothetical protein E3226_005510 [Legionella geestiana]
MPETVETCEKTTAAILEPLQRRREQCAGAQALVRKVISDHFMTSEKLKQDGLVEAHIRAGMLTSLDTSLNHPLMLDACIKACFPDLTLQASGMYAYNASRALPEGAARWYEELAISFSVLRTILSLDLLCCWCMEDPFLDTSSERACFEAAETLSQRYANADASRLPVFFHALNEQGLKIDALFSQTEKGREHFISKLAGGTAAVTELLHKACTMLEASYRACKNTYRLWMVWDTPWHRTLKQLTAALVDNQYTCSTREGTLTIYPAYRKALHADFVAFNDKALQCFPELRRALLVNASHKNQTLRTSIQAMASQQRISLEELPRFFAEYSPDPHLPVAGYLECASMAPERTSVASSSSPV